MKLYNRGSRVINPNTPQAILPGKWSQELDEAEGKKLLKMFPRDLTASVEDVNKINTRITELEAEKAKLTQENAALKAQVANFEKLVQASAEPDLAAVVTSESTPAPVAVPQAAPVAAHKAGKPGKR